MYFCCKMELEILERELDELKLSSQKNVKKRLQSDEQVVASFNIFKYNEYKNRQERNIMVTNKGVYNLKSYSIKRFIPFASIAAITVAYFGNEFVIHVPSEYDYRYSSFDRMDSILLVLTREYVAC